MVKIKCIDEYTTRLKMLPVCDCGYVFKDGYDISDYENLGGNDENGYSVDYHGEYIKGE